ncbi:hypothetical protein BCR35DRAFT_352013 [Leucosporidium creatinivorum]|uniref:VTT domain-containing protein n=1 Tax=Leucosporidium creatinivorum TaxID=106004 RepID=A0A1Y2FK02_9BASI|nr:hypothetical protein BCR35DRAFT_352013 [Leucosporidium creatinivorum]
MPPSGSGSDSPSRPASVDLPADLARPSSLSLRPQLGVQTRIRARSITSGSGAASPVVPYLSPTLAGSPTLPGVESFLVPGSSLSQSPLSRQQGGSDDDGDEGSDRTPDAEESGSTESESPPSTPAGPSRGTPTFRVSGDWVQESLRMQGTVSPTHEKQQPYQYERTALEGSTRHNLRRGRSFTSLLMQPNTPSPRVERPDPILEQRETHSPTLSDIESGEERPLAYGPSSYPPEATAAPPLPRPTKTIRDFVPQVLTLLVLFIASFAVIALLVATLPNLHIPHSVSDLPALTSSLSTYRASSYFAELHLFVVLTALFLWKQCFSIPGSVLTNILFGALYGTAAGTWWACIWTALGSTGAYGIALVISPLVEYYFATPLDVTRRALKLPHPDQASTTSSVTPLSTGDLFSHLLLARFFPLLPYSVLNVISGVLRLPLPIFFITLVVGSFPFNFVTVSIGQLVAIAASDPSTSLSNKIWSGAVLAKLAMVTFVSVVPLVFKKQLQAALGSPRLAAAVQALPGQAAYAWDRTRNAAVRKVFGFGIITTSSHSSKPSGGSAAQWKRKGEWRRKWNRSWGGDGFGVERTLTGAEVSRSLMGRWEGDEGDALAVMEAGEEEAYEEEPLLGPS